MRNNSLAQVSPATAGITIRAFVCPNFLVPILFVQIFGFQFCYPDFYPTIFCHNCSNSGVASHSRYNQRGLWSWLQIQVSNIHSKEKSKSIQIFISKQTWFNQCVLTTSKEMADSSKIWPKPCRLLRNQKIDAVFH